jgi:hypothetical protein
MGRGVIEHESERMGLRRLRLATVGAGCALIGVVCFFAGIVLTVSTDVGTIIAEAREQGLTWIADVRDAREPPDFTQWEQEVLAPIAKRHHNQSVGIGQSRPPRSGHP